MQEETGLSDAVVCGLGKIKGREVAIAVMDARFIVGSMGSVVGEKITRCEEGLDRELPLVPVAASGGPACRRGCCP